MSESYSGDNNVFQNLLSPRNSMSISENLLTSLNSPVSIETLKLFDTYLSLVNSANSYDTKIVIRKADYSRFLNVKQIKTEVLTKITDDLLSLQLGIGGEKSKARICVNLFDIAGTFTDRKTGEVKICLKCSEFVKPLLSDLQVVGRVQYQLKNILLLKTDYEARLYIYLISQVNKGVWEISFGDLKKKLNCDKQKLYQKYGEFNRKILKPSINIINEKTNLSVKYEYHSRRYQENGTGKIQFTLLEYYDIAFSQP